MVQFFSHADKKNSCYPLALCAVSINHIQEPIYRPKGVCYYQWLFCCKGKGELTAESGTFHIDEGQGFFINKWEPYSYRGVTEDFKLHCICFAGACATEILKACNMCETGVYHVEKPELFTEYIQTILNVQNTDGSQKEYSKLCFGFLVELGENIRRLAMPYIYNENKIIHAVIRMLEEDFQKPVTLETLSESMHLSKNYLCTMFKRETGYSIIQYLMIIRIGWARLYLEQFPEKTVYEIGKMCGFEDASYFGKKFREAVGVTPEKYKYVKAITTSVT